MKYKQFVLAFLGCLLINLGSSQGATREILVSPEISIPDGRPATTLTWSPGAFPKYDNAGNRFLLSTFSGRLEVPDGFDQFFGGGALVKMTEPDTGTPLFFDDLVIPGDDGFVFLDSYPHSDGEVIVTGRESGDGSPRLYSLEGGGSLTEIHGALALDGVGSVNGRATFHTTFFGTREVINAVIPGGPIETIVSLGDDGGDGTTIAEIFSGQINRLGRPAFFGRLEGAGVEFINEKALYRETPSGAVERVVRGGLLHPMDPRLVNEGTFGAINHLAKIGYNDAGDVAFSTSITSNTFPSGSASSIWFSEVGGTPELVAVIGEQASVLNAGDVYLDSFITAPIVDALGSVYFIARYRPWGTVGLTNPALWKWNEDGLSRVVSYDDSLLPFPPTRLPGPDGSGGDRSYTMEIDEVSSFQPGPDGRMAIFGVIAEVERLVETPEGGEPIVTETRKRIGQCLWAQDDDGAWDLIQTRLLRPNEANNPPPDGTGDLVVSGTNFGRAISLSLPETRFIVGSGGEDGLVLPWWTDDGKITYAASVLNEGLVEGYTILATAGNTIEPAEGPFVWDGTAGTFDWSTPTNWVDDMGRRWQRKPGEETVDEVTIGAPYEVILSENAGTISLLDVKGKLKLASDGALRVSGDVVLNDMTVEDVDAFVAERNVLVSGDILGAGSGLKSEPGSPFTMLEIAPLAELTGTVTGLWSVAPEGVEIINKGSVSGIFGAGMLVQSTTGTILIETSGSVSSSGSKGIIAQSQSGLVGVYSALSGMANGISAVDDGISITTDGVAGVEYFGDIDVQAANATVNAIGIFVESRENWIEIYSEGALSTNGVGSGLGTGSGIWAKGKKDVFVNQKGSVVASGWGVRAESSNGDVIIDTSESMISSESGGLFATAVGEVAVYSGEIGTTNADAIRAVGEDDVLVEVNGDLSTSGEPFNGVAGISARSNSQNVTIRSVGEVSTTSTKFSPCIEGWANRDLLIDHEGSLSTFNGDAITAEGFDSVVIRYRGGDIAATNDGGGITAECFGALDIMGSDPTSGIETQGGTDAIGIYSWSTQSLRINWAGPISAASDGIVAIGDSGGIEVITHSGCEGRSGDGINVSGPSVITVRTLGGTVHGGGTNGASVRISGGTSNRVINSGYIKDANAAAIYAESGDETVTNTGVIEGSLLLGTGDNKIENKPGGLLRLRQAFLGDGKELINEGRIETYNAGAPTTGGTIQGDFRQTSGTLSVGLVPGGNADVLGVVGTASLGGILQIKRAGPGEFMVGDSFVVLSATSITGQFSGLDQAGLGSGIRFEIVYLPTGVLVTAVSEVCQTYGDWRLAEFSGPDATNEFISGPDADPDGDGLRNLFEYLYGLDPNVPGASALDAYNGGTTPEGVRYLDIEFRWRIGMKDYAYGFEQWNGFVYQEVPLEILSSEALGDVEIIRARVTVNQLFSAGFVRLKVLNSP